MKDLYLDLRKRENECKENGEKRNNVNSFNKIIKLRVTDDIEYSELLFWKIFRNSDQ
ncbi:hypothetical protein DDB_G0288445 [Dictyostelium discoideum AX4]|uniref:Uncharacterized protein n=1 Tax=Dictyostelium discoideum TaxID=44689 RepID=Q54IZ5_DICDI|nr:hypothetical protein DDB_G0288445 [Dictyostelium discoideum AX4]EAL63248.1 hypothetical protein DDB_G0288445 [Dictyostelium discoideum AX4]|eukprot:XP_636735.1 hypothetical protein DDB_G0288445 [Dictyostelium discoideum AX4]